METAADDDDPLTPPISTVDDGAGASSYNKTIGESIGSTCEDSAHDWERWVSVGSTVDAGDSGTDWRCDDFELALDAIERDTRAQNGHACDPDATFFWDAQETQQSPEMSTVWPVGSSLLPSGNGHSDAIRGFEIVSELGRGGMGDRLQGERPAPQAVGRRSR